MPGLPVHHQLPESTQTHVHWVGDAIQPSHPLSSPSPPAFNLSQHQGLFQWVSSSNQVTKVLEFQHQHQSFQWTLRTDFPWDGLVGSPCSPRGSQDSSPTPQFKSISSLVLSFLYSPTISNCQMYITVLLTIVTCCMFFRAHSSYNWKFVPLNQHLPISPTLSPWQPPFYPTSSLSFRVHI